MTQSIETEQAFARASDLARSYTNTALLAVNNAVMTTPTGPTRELLSTVAITLETILQGDEEQIKQLLRVINNDKSEADEIIVNGPSQPVVATPELLKIIEWWSKLDVKSREAALLRVPRTTWPWIFGGLTVEEEYDMLPLGAQQDVRRAYESYFNGH